MMRSVFILVFCLFISTNSQKIIPTLQRCSLSSPDLDTCMKNAAQESLPYLANGIPSIGLPPIDPLKVDNVEVDQTALKLSFMNPYIIGLKEARINSFKVDQKKKQIFLDYTKDGSFQSKYKISGQLLIIPIRGEGDSTIKFTNLNYKFVFDYEPITKQGKTYWKITKHKVQYSTEKAQYIMTNLFNGNKQLADTASKVLNDNWKILFNDQSPDIMSKVTKNIAKVVTKFLLNVPVDELFTP